ncbi:MAG: S8 family peptidase [Bacteroidetes bacterium]|nr:S8 family peptidase [Bacteroidota bacterium]
MRKFSFGCLAALFISMNCVASNPFNKTKQPLKLKDGDYVKGTVIIKLKPEAAVVCHASSIDLGSMNEKLALLGATVNKRFPRANDVSNLRNRQNEKLVDISRIYTVKFNENTSVADAISILLTDPSVAYAEPQYINRLCYTPSDPSGTLQLQYFLDKIQAYNAWDIWKGDTNTVIGIVDSGTDWDHPDLAANVAKNWADPIDGIDNDADGFTDNFHGWDISENDNDPTNGNSDHGSHVSGCAAEVTDNGTGGAGPSFKCRFMGVKSSLDASTTSIDNGYDGIVYAADHGCNIINLSWGRGGGFSQFESDIIDYAAINHDVTVVTAAGNSGLDETFYPTQYDNAISVASTGSNDGKSSFSNYGFKIDVCAPGDNIYSTVINNTYTYMSGTSMASPVAAGCAAMIKSRFPSFNHEQVRQQLRNTADNIYAVSGNTVYQNKLGKGRVNLFKAMSDTTSPGVRANIVSIVDNNDEVFVGNDTMSIVALFKNLLRPTANLTCNLTASSNQVSILQNTFTIGALNTLDTISNFASMFRVRIKSTAPINLTVPFKLTMTDGAWTDFLSFNVVVNVDYINIEKNDISTSQTSKGRIGYNTSGPGEGLGFHYMGGPSNVYEMGLMIGDGTHAVANAVRNETGAYDEDFGYSVRVTESANTVSDFFASGKCNNNGPSAPGNKLSIEVPHYTYAWNTNPDRGYIITEYVIRNIGTSTISNLHAGIFADWDVNDVADTSTNAFNSNRDTVDLARKMGIAYNSWADGYYCGIKLLTNTAPFHHYGIDNVAGGNGGVDIADAADYFSDADKFLVLSTNRDVAGHVNPEGNDVCDVTSTGPYTIAPGDSITVAFALTCGENLLSIQNSADAAQIKYDNIHLGVTENVPSDKMLLSVYPNPASSSSAITFTVKNAGQVELSLFNELGEKVLTLANKKMNSGLHAATINLTELPAGNYFVQLQSEGKTEVQKLLITR